MTLILLASSLYLSAIEADLAYVDDITTLTDACYIRAIKLDDALLTDDAGEPYEALVGRLELADGEHTVQITAEPEGPALRVDLDGTGELVRTEWERVLLDGSFLADISLTLTYGDGKASAYQLFLVWTHYLPTVMTFCRNTYREGQVTLGNRRIAVAIVDADTDGRYDRLDGGVLLIDTDGDGELLATGDSHERFFLDEPFNVDGVTYEVDAVSDDGSWIRFEKSEEQVAAKAPLLPGFAAPDFSAMDSSGQTVSPTALRGNAVLLSFWAGWCGSCIAELPTLRQVVSAFGDQGVVVLGINVDRTAAEFDAAVAEHGIDWPQIYDGPVGPIGTLFRIEGIPMAYLVGADGVIVARGLRGQRLLNAVADVLGDGDEEGSGG
jgi:thiol-disulfide isomerase/thioredoxin